MLVTKGVANKRAAQIYLHFVEQIGFVKGGAIDALVRRSDGQWAIECIVVGADRKGAAIRGRASAASPPRFCNRLTIHACSVADCL